MEIFALFLSTSIESESESERARERERERSPGHGPQPLVPASAMSTVLGEALRRVARGVAGGWRLGALQTSSSSVEVGAGLSTSGSFAALARRQHGEASGTGDPNSASSKLVDTIYDPGRRVERVPAAVLEDMVSLLTRARARDVTVIELKDNPLADHFVVATGRSLDHLKRIAGGCQHLLKKADLPSRIEGGEGSEWVLLDG